MNEGATFTVLLNRKTVDIPGIYRFITIDRNGSIEVWRTKPQWRSGIWESPDNSYPIGVVDDSVDIRKTKVLIWKTGDGKYFNFDKILKEEGFIRWQLRNNLELNESQKISFVEGDDVEIPNGYKFAAIDANGDICVFKEEPSLETKGEYSTYKGKGKAQVGVAVWNWSKLPGKPTEFKEAIPEVEKIMPDFVKELKDGLDLGGELNDSGAFKIVFPKYGDIEKL